MGIATPVRRPPSLLAAVFLAAALLGGPSAGAASLGWMKGEAAWTFTADSFCGYAQGK